MVWIYLDLCRLYTTQNLVVAFATTVKTIEKLMDDLTDMHNLQISPDDYELYIIEETDSLPAEIKALKKKGNIKLKLTAAEKSRHGFRIARKSSWAGQLLQDTSFTRDAKTNEENNNVIEKLLKGLAITPEMSASNRVWLGVPMSQVFDVLEAFKTPSMRSLEMNNYIKAIQNETKNKELSKCNIVLLSNRFDSSDEYLGGYQIARTERQKSSERHMRAVHVTDEEFIDLFIENKLTSRTDKVSLRKKDTAVLLIYPIKIENSLEILSIAMSFPNTKALPASKTTYVVADGTYVG